MDETYFEEDFFEFEGLGAVDIASASDDEDIPVETKKPSRSVEDMGFDSGEEYDPIEGSSSEEVGSEDSGEEEETAPPVVARARARASSLTLPTSREAPQVAPARLPLPSSSTARREQVARFSFYPGEQKDHARIVERAIEAARHIFPNDPNPQALGLCVLNKTLYGHSYIPSVEVKLVTIIHRMSSVGTSS